MFGGWIRKEGATRIGPRRVVPVVGSSMRNLGRKRRNHTFVIHDSHA